jgi:hypothetical protein
VTELTSLRETQKIIGAVRIAFQGMAYILVSVTVSHCLVLIVATVDITFSVTNSICLAQD